MFGLLAVYRPWWDTESPKHRQGSSPTQEHLDRAAAGAKTRCTLLELWFDFSCPFAYLASRRAPQLPTEIDWRPMLLGGVFRGIGAGDGPMSTLSPAKALHNLHDMHRWADLFDVPFRMPAGHPMRTVRALRVL